MSLFADAPRKGAPCYNGHRVAATIPFRSVFSLDRLRARWLLACTILLGGLGVSLPGLAQSSANGSALFHGGTYACYSCHSAGYVAGGLPSLPQLNAANVSSVLSHAIVNNAGSWMGTYRSTAVDGGANGAQPLSASDRADIVAYLQTVNAANFPASVAVPYHGATAAIPLKLDVTTGRFTSVSYGSPARGSVAAGTPIAYNSLQGSAGQESTAVYTHTANNCTADSFNVSASGAAGTSSSRTINITVTAPAAPTAASSSPVAAAYNTATAIPVTLGGGATASLAIVSGLANGGNLTINGTSSFTYTSNASVYSATDAFTYRAVGPCGLNSSNVLVNINISAPPTPVVSSSGVAAGNGGQAFSYQIAASNLPTSYSVTGALPPGVTVNTTTGLISGTPTSAGSFPVTVNATNSSGTGGKALSITIATVTPAISSPNTASGTGGQPFSYQITAENLPTGYGVVGVLPDGVTLNAATGLISGTPVVLGSFPVTIQASNSAGTGSQALTITVSAIAPVISSGNTAGGTGGQPFSYQITASNLPASYSVTGALPAGVSVNASTGLISGTPTTTGNFPVTINASNASGTGSQALAITITLIGPVVTSADTASGTGGQPFSYQITANNLPTSYSVSSPLPAGVTLNASTGLISGTPTVSGNFPVTVNAINAAGTGSKAVGITINLVTPVVTSAGAAGGTSGQPFSYQIAANNLPASFGATGLPPGVTVNAATGLVSGTPSVGGNFGATVTATNAAGTGSQALAISLTFVAPASAATAITVPYNTPATFNLPVTGQFTQVNIVTPPTSGSLPAPAAASSSVTYTPQAGYTGADSFSYNATGPGGTSATAFVTITVDTLAPTAAATSMTVQLNTAATLDLAPFISGSAITGVAIAGQPAHGTVTMSGTTVTYTPVNNYFGDDSFTYTAFGNAGTSPAALVSVTVAGRPDVSKDAAVVALAASQVETARRFSRAQVSNFQARMESLHRRGSGAGNGDGGGAASFAPGAGSRREAGAVTALAMNRISQAGAPNSAAAQPGSTLGAGAYKPAATLSSPSSSDMTATRALPAESALPTLVAALAASGSQGGSQAADIGGAMMAVADALNNRSLSLAYSTGRADGDAGMLGGTDFWVGGGVKFGTRDRGARNGGLSFSTDGISMGLDRRFSDELALGVGLGYGQDQTDIGTDGTNSRAKSVTLAAYGSYQPTDHIFIDGMLGYGELSYRTDRFITPISDFARSDRSGSFVFGSLTGGYEFRTTGMLISPYGRLDLARHTLDQATESGGGAYALTYAKQTTPSTQFALGLRAETAHETSFGWALPRLRVEFQREFRGEQPALVSYADLINGPFYALPANTVDRNSIVLGVGSDFILPRGLTFSLDYQTQRVSGQEQNQAIFFSLKKDLDGKGSSGIPIAALTRGALRIDTDVAYTYDDNVTRASADSDRYADSMVGLDLSKRFIFPLGDRARLLFKAFAGGEKLRTYTGLDRVYAGGEAELQYRAAGAFDTPIFGVFASATATDFESDLRDGHRYSAGVSMLKPLTDRINMFGALSRNMRYGRSAVFDTSDTSARINLDYGLPASTLYLTGEFRRGDIVSTGTHTLVNIDIADVFVRDDVFSSPQLYSYRVDGKTVLFTVGYSLPLGQKDSLDVSWRHVLSSPSRKPFFAERPRYSVNQLSIVYLTSF